MNGKRGRMKEKNKKVDSKEKAESVKRFHGVNAVEALYFLPYRSFVEKKRIGP